VEWAHQRRVERGDATRRVQVTARQQRRSSGEGCRREQLAPLAGRRPCDRAAVCGSNGFNTEPRDSPNEPHASPPGGSPSACNRERPSIEPSIETLSRR